MAHGVSHARSKGANGVTQLQDGFWKVPRSAQQGALQLARRQDWPDMPFIHGEIQQRMLERASIMRPAQGPVIDMSLGRLDATAQLAGQFADRPLHLVRWGRALASVKKAGWLSKGLSRLARFSALSGSGGAGQPFDPDVRLAGQLVLNDEFGAGVHWPTATLVWSNGLLHRVAQPQALLALWHRVLAPGGALFFSCFGPDTAPQLRDVSAQLGLPFTDFADMHDWGDLLIKAGFSDPVMEMERLVLTYRSADMLLRDWHALGGNPASQRTAHLLGRGFAQRLQQGLQNSTNGSLQISLEILYGHAWRVERKQSAREFTIPLSEIRRKP